MILKFDGLALNLSPFFGPFGERIRSPLIYRAKLSTYSNDWWRKYVL
jgi:hypothetical protein